MEPDITPPLPERNAAATQNPERRRLLTALAACGLAALTARSALAAETTQDQSLSVVKPARPAPDFTLEDLDGKPHRLSDYRGKVVLVNFWATWCPPCRAEMPSIEKLVLSLKNKPFAALALDQGESLNQVFAFMGQLDPAPTFPVLLDGKSAAAHAFGVMGIPTSYLIDPHGNIVRQAVGGRDFDTPAMRQLIESLMA